jgi:hypothetical protein
MGISMDGHTITAAQSGGTCRWHILGISEYFFVLQGVRGAGHACFVKVCFVLSAVFGVVGMDWG